MHGIQDGLLGNRESQNVMVLSGLGGSGKTQLALKFVNDNEDM